MIASEFSIPEVMICFGNELIRGNRSRKVSTTNLDAFDSPNCGHLGSIGVYFKIFWNRVLGHSFFGEFNVHTELD